MFDRGKTVMAGDVALFVSEVGNSDGPPIILLHGGLGCREDFAKLAVHLAADYRLIAIDSRGHGRSTFGHAAMTYHQLTNDIAAVVQKLGLTGAGIIGHSDGGIVALRLAASGLFQARFIVAVGAHWNLLEDDPTRGIYQGIDVDSWREMFGLQVSRYEAENPDADFPRLFAATQAMWLGSGPEAYPGETVRDITTPLLVVHGDGDFLVTLAHAFDLVERVQGAKLLNLPFASHTVLEDDPEAVLPSLLSFISNPCDQVQAES